MIQANYDEIIKRKLTIAVSGENYCSSITPTKGEHEYEDGEIVSLSASATGDGQFDGWSGDVYYSGGYKVKMDADKTVTASFSKFVPTYYTVTVKASPTGGGTVTGAAYDMSYIHSVSAKAASGYKFVRWSDGGAQTHYVCGNQDLTAYFEATTTYVTAQFYNHSGTNKTLLKTDTVVSGGTPTPPSTAPTLTGWTFDGWSPSVGAITSDTNYYAKWKLSFSANVTTASGSGEAAYTSTSCTIPIGTTITTSVSGTAVHDTTTKKTGHQAYVGAGPAKSTSGRRFVTNKWETTCTASDNVTRQSFTLSGSSGACYVSLSSLICIQFYVVKYSDACQVSWTASATVTCTLT